MLNFIHNVEIKTKKLKFTVADYLSIYKYNNYFRKVYQQNRTEDVFMIKNS